MLGTESFERRSRVGEEMGERGRDNEQAKDKKDGKKETNKVEEKNTERQRMGGDSSGEGGGL